MRIAIVLLIIGLCSLSLTAQDDEQATVYSVAGKVKYSPKARGWFNYQTLQTGTRLAAEGRLKVKKGAEVAILQDGEFTVLQGKQRKSVTDVLRDARAFRDDDYAATFASYVKDSEHPYFRQPSVLGFASTNVGPGSTIESGPVKPPPKKSKEGHQDPNAALVPVSPNSTSTSPAKTTGKLTAFRWLLKADAGIKGENYQLAILDNSGKVLWEESVLGNTHTVDLSSLDLKAGEYYKWRASLAGEAGKNTSAVPFQYIAEAKVEQLLENLKSSEFYTSASPEAQLLIEAVTLEEEGLQSMAYDRYESALAKDAKNELAAAMFTTFLWRYDGIQ
ncbi:MAG: hypothetical protein GVY26_16680 [Bacteroidetes bacterium]|jgi:hypothetical protein|nr:hypothetical protein [Bacteroidota bacterium]